MRLTAGALSLLAILSLTPAGEPGAGVPFLGPKKAIDLTHPLNSKTPHWPGARYHPFRSEVIAELETDGVFSKVYCTPEHLGTHVDAPNHFERGQPALDEILLEDLMAPAVVIDLTAKADEDPDALLTLADVRRWEERNLAVPKKSIVLLRTGWAERIGDAEAYQNRDDAGRLHFPGFSPEAARYLIGERQARALGIDTLSIDAGISADFEVHHIVNGAGRYGLENVANLDRLPETGAFLIVAPLKATGASGGQARVFAFLP